MKNIFFIILFLLFFTPAIALAVVNINTAGLGELDTITGVGPAIGQKIIDYRNANGSFKTIEEIKNVSGIGDATFAKMKDQITVGEISGSGSEKEPNDSSENTSLESSEGESSSHTGEVVAEDYKKETLKVSAGRDRLATIKTPILFSAVMNKKGKTNYLTWSFGDGTSAMGVDVYHAYQFPGTYNVVLNANIDNEEVAVSRALVTVVESRVKISAVDLWAGYVEISNQSEKEQNINNWYLSFDGKKYLFPLDTVISAKSKIKIPLASIGLGDKTAKEIALFYPDSTLISLIDLSKTPIFKELDGKKVLAKMGQGNSFSNREVAEKRANDRPSQNSKNVIVLEKPTLGWWEKIKHAIFE